MPVINFKFERVWYEAKLLKQSKGGDAYYHIVLKDKELIKRFGLSYLFAWGVGSGFYNIGGKLFPEHRGLHRSLITALVLFVSRQKSEREAGKEQKIFLQG